MLSKEWECPCGVWNHEMRKECRECGSERQPNWPTREWWPDFEGDGKGGLQKVWRVSYDQ